MNIPKKARYRRGGKFGVLDMKHDASVPDFSTATCCYNFDFGSGALRGGYGIEDNENVPTDATRYFVYRYYSNDAKRYVDQCVYQLSNGEIMFYDSYTGVHRYMSGYKYPPISVINYRLNSEDVLLVSCEGRWLMTWNGRIMLDYDSSPIVSSMALHYERLFVASSAAPTKVFFSDDLNPTNWKISSDEGGFIELLDERGCIQKLVSFGNYLYLFREHGISRLTAFADQNEFSVINLFMSTGRINPESIAVCGSIIIFAADDGLFAFDGYECTRILKNLDGLTSGATAVASAYYCGKYYLSLKVDFGDGKKIGCENGEYMANALLVYDVNLGEYSVSRGLDIRYMNACSYLGNDMLTACDGTRGGVIARNGSRFGESLPKLWTSALTDFGTPDRTKTLREVYIDADVDCSIACESEKREKRVAVKRGKRRVRVNVCAKQLKMSIQTDAADCNIRVPTLIYS